MTSSDGWRRPLPDGLEHVRSLGQGGFGEVVLARQTSLDRLVAVKRVHAGGWTRADDLRRFRREAQVLARLDSPTIVRVFDHRTDDGDAVLVMEYVPGRPLHELIVPGGMPVAAALTVLRDVATALTVAAAAGVTHRDVKPANVFVTEDGRAKLGDFGLARIAADAGLFRTSDGGVRGTPAYMAPETGLGQQEPGPRSDAYSWAVLAFEVLTGRLPFTAEDPLALWAAHDSTAPPTPSAVAPHLPAAVDAVLLAGLAKDPARRPTAQQMADALTAVPAAAWGAPRDAPQTAVPGAWMPAAPTVVPAPAGGTAPATVVTGAADPGPPWRPAPPAPDAVAALLNAGPGRPLSRRDRRRNLVPRRLLTVGLPLVTALLAVVAVRWWQQQPQQEAADPPISLTSAEVVVTPADGSGACPGADYRATATLLTSGGAGRLDADWTLPDGRLETSPPVEVSAGQNRVVLSLDFRLTGDVPLQAPTVVTLSGSVSAQATSPLVQYSC